MPLASDSNAGASAVGESDDHAAPVVRVWVAAHEIEPLELVYELGDGLARDVGVRGEVAGARTVLADVAQERGVRGRDIAKAVACEIGADGGLDRGASVAEKDLEALRHLHTIVVHLA